MSSPPPASRLPPPPASIKASRPPPPADASFHHLYTRDSASSRIFLFFLKSTPPPASVRRLMSPLPGLRLRPVAYIHSIDVAASWNPLDQTRTKGRSSKIKNLGLLVAVIGGFTFIVLMLLTIFLICCRRNNQRPVIHHHCEGLLDPAHRLFMIPEQYTAIIDGKSSSESPISLFLFHSPPLVPNTSTAMTNFITERGFYDRLSEQCFHYFPCLSNRARRSSLGLKAGLVLLHVVFVGGLFF